MHEPDRPRAAPPRSRALTIAGSDSGGGAGIQADLKTFSALGVYGMTAITAVTVQNTRGVSGYEAMTPDLVAAQILSVAGDIGVDAAKTGMLANAGVVEAVAGAVSKAGIGVLVVDPVFVSKHGHALLDGDAVEVLKRRLLPLATLVTPNLSEASALAGFEVTGRDDMWEAARAILTLGPRAVLVKGGHLADDADAADLLVDGSDETWIAAERIDMVHTHGTGCTLSAAIAAYLALGRSLEAAVRAGKDFVTEAIGRGMSMGGGIGPVDQLWAIEPPPFGALDEPS